MENKIYLDHNATTFMDKEIISVMMDYAKYPSNPSSTHYFGRIAREALENARVSIAQALEIDIKKDGYQVLFTSTGTESNNLVINSFLDHHVFVSSIEHPSILKPFEEVKNRTILDVDRNGLIDIEKYESALKTHPGQKLVSIMLANNESGVIQDIKKLSKIAHENDAIFHTDAIQAFGKIEFDLKDLGCDLATISSHKCGGPVGASALIFKASLKMKASLKGGGQEYGIRSGTENIMAIAGFSATLEKIQERINSFKKINLLRDEIEEQLSNFAQDIEIYGKNAPRIPNTSLIKMPDVDNLLQIIKFDLKNIAISAGSACSSGKIETSHVLKAMGIAKHDADCTIRISLGVQTKKDEIDKFIAAWKEIFEEAKNRRKND